MASISIHFAVAKQFIKKNTIINENEFYQGILNPDLVNDKNMSHYSGLRDKNKLFTYLAQKVQLYEYVKNTNINSDYERGIFLHLITDYLLFNTFFNNEYINNTSYADFSKDLYYSYNKTNKYLEKKYELDYKNFLTQIEIA